jgi:spore coat polysaccharide biosynthesis protein SpsF
METVSLILQARIRSSRLPAKILLPLGNVPLLEKVLTRLLRAAPPIDSINLASSFSSELAIEEGMQFFFSKKHGVPIRRWYGDEKDVLSRFVTIIQEIQPTYIIRATADNPFLSIKHLVQAYEAHLKAGAIITKYVNLPIGTAVEVVTAKVLEEISTQSLQNHHREHVTPYLYEHPECYPLQLLQAEPPYDAPHIRLTIDEEADYVVAKRIVSSFMAEGVDTPPLSAILKWLESHPDVSKINQAIPQRMSQETS